MFDIGIGTTAQTTAATERDSPSNVTALHESAGRVTMKAYRRR